MKTPLDFSKLNFSNINYQSNQTENITNFNTDTNNNENLLFSNQFKEIEKNKENFKNITDINERIYSSNEGNLYTNNFQSSSSNIKNDDEILMKDSQLRGINSDTYHKETNIYNTFNNDQIKSDENNTLEGEKNFINENP